MMNAEEKTLADMGIHKGHMSAGEYSKNISVLKTYGKHVLESQPKQLSDEQIELEVQHIFDSGANEIRFVELIKRLRDRAGGGVDLGKSLSTAISLLSVVRCPNPNCDDNGTIAVQDQHGDTVPEPCQWCDERKRLTNHNQQEK